MLLMFLEKQPEIFPAKIGLMNLVTDILEGPKQIFLDTVQLRVYIKNIKVQRSLFYFENRRDTEWYSGREKERKLRKKNKIWFLTISIPIKRLGWFK